MKIPTEEYDTMADEVIEEFGNLSLANRQFIELKVMFLTLGEGDRISVVDAVTGLVV